MTGCSAPTCCVYIGSGAFWWAFVKHQQRSAIACCVWFVDRAEGDVAVGALEGLDDVSSGGCRSWGYC